MSRFINGSYNSNSKFYTRELIDKEKLIAKTFKNIESKLSIIDQYKNKYGYNNNNVLGTMVINKFDFIEILNEFEDTISQSLQGICSLIVEIKNLKEKNEYQKIKSIKPSKYKSYGEQNSLYNNIYGSKNLNNFFSNQNKLYKCIDYTNDGDKCDISDDSINNRDIYTYNKNSIIVNDLNNQSNSIVSKEFNTVVNDSKMNYYNRILRLQLKKNNILKNKNNSFSKKYELELKNTNEDKNEKIEVEIKLPLRQEIKQLSKEKNLKKDNSKVYSTKKLKKSFSNKYNINNIK